MSDKGALELQDIFQKESHSPMSLWEHLSLDASGASRAARWLTLLFSLA